MVYGGTIGFNLSDSSLLIKANKCTSISAMVELLKFALEKQRYDAAAYAIAYGLIKVKKDGKKAGQKDSKTGILRSRPG
jgi:hypothetical protein